MGPQRFLLKDIAFAILAVAILLIRPNQWIGKANASVITIIKMHDMPSSYDPNKVTIHVGDTVEWQNVGNSVHQASDDQQMAVKGDDVATPAHGDVFDSGFMRPGEKFTHTFATPGTYRYFCAPHETDGMVGEIIVEPNS